MDLAHQIADARLAIDGLPTRVEKRLHRRARIGVTQQGLGEERLVPKSIDQRPLRRGSHRLLRDTHGVRWECRDPTCQFVDVRRQVVCRQRTIEESPPLGRDGIDMQSRQDFKDRHVHKDAGMDRTIVMGCVPNEVPEMPTHIAEVPWSEVPHPPTDDDGPVTVFHIVRADGRFDHETLARSVGRA